MAKVFDICRMKIFKARLS